MKKKILSTLIVVAMLFTPLFTLAESEPGDPGIGPSGPPLGGGAPIGGGTFILIALGAAYGAKKVYEMNREELED